MQAASIAKSYSHYPADRDDKRLSYKISIKQAFQAMIALGYLKEVKQGSFIAPLQMVSLQKVRYLDIK